MRTTSRTHSRPYSLLSLFPKYRLILLLLLLVQGLTPGARAQMRQLYVDNDADNDIRKISFYSPAEGFVAFYKWIGYTTDSGRTFAQKTIRVNNVNFNGFTNVNLTFGFGITGVKAFAADNLLVYGNYGFVPAILRSTDQGNSFTLIYLSQLNAQKLTDGITDMVFPQNSNIGYAVEADRIIKTINKGQSWFPVYTSPNSFFDIVEAAGNFIYAFNTSTNRFLQSTDNGSSWVGASAPAGQIRSASFIAPGKGWLHINNEETGLLYYTSNGGTSWTLMNDPAVTPFFTRKMKFINDSTGYALTYSFTVLKTTDSGKVWEPLPRITNNPSPDDEHYDIHFWDQDQLWAGGGHGFLELSTNAGGTPIPTPYFRIDATDTWLTHKVDLINYSKPGYQYKWYVNDVLISTSYHASYNHAMVNGLDSVKLVVTQGGVSDSLTRYQHFVVPPLPTITSFTPQTGSTGTLITINGANFKDITDVKFGGVSASSFTIVSPEKITAIAGSGASGDITLVHIYGNFSAPGFTYFQPPSSPPPVISSFSPASGPVGTIVTITGNNFDPLPANNIVYFGDTRATVNNAGVTQLTCTVPAGARHKPVLVLNTTTHLQGQSLKPFITTFADSVTALTNKSFRQAHAIFYPNNAGIKCATSADIDNDGKTDIVATLSVWNQDTIVVYRNTTSNGGFSFAARVTVGPLFSKLASGRIYTFDVDGDGLEDILGATNTADLTLYRNTSVAGKISFAAPIFVPATEGTQDVKLSDLDGDGKPDLVIVGSTSPTAISVIRNTSSPGHISFAPAINYAFNASHHLTIGHMDNDGKNDIVVLSALSQSYGVSLFKNNSTPGAIAFAPRKDLTSRAGTGGGIMLADLDNDNKLDIVIKLTAEYIIGRNTGTTGNASFDFSTRATVYGGAAVESLSGDSYPDVVAGSEVFLNNSTPGTIQQAAAVTLAGTNYGSYTHTADFNNDGKADVLMASWSSSNAAISIFKNEVGVPIDFTICSGNTVIDADINGASFQWQQDDGSGFVTINDNSNFAGAKSNKLTLSNVPGAWAGYKFRCLVNGTYYSSTYKIRTQPLPPPAITIGASATSICSGTNVTFTAYDNSGWPATSYKWQLNGSDDYTTTPIFTPIVWNLTNNSQVRVIGIFRDECFNYATDTSDYITITVKGEYVPVTISTPSTAICANTPVTFTATPGTGADNPIYQWQVDYVNAGTNSATFTTADLTNHQVRVLMTASSACPQSPVATSNSISVYAQTPEVPGVFISGASAPVCAGELVLFTATPGNINGTSPLYQWKKNGQNVGTNSQWYEDRTLVNRDVIAVEMTTYFACETRNITVSDTETIQVSAPVTPSIAISGNTMVDKGKTTTIQASAVNGGTLPVYTWEDSTKAHNWTPIVTIQTPAFTYTPAATGDKIRCQLISNAPCVVDTKIFSAPLTFTVNAPTAIEPVTAASGIQLYPNPVTNTLIVDSMNLMHKWTTLEITNMSGNRILSRNISGKTKVEVWVADLPKGMYVAVLRQKSGAAYYYKFVKIGGQLTS